MALRTLRRPVRHWAANDGLQGAVDGTVKLDSSALDVAGTEDEGNLGEGKARAQKDALNLSIAHAMKGPKHLRKPGTYNFPGGPKGQPRRVKPRRTVGMSCGRTELGRHPLGCRGEIWSSWGGSLVEDLCALQCVVQQLD